MRDKINILKFFIFNRWGKYIKCPYCENIHITNLTKGYHCNSCNTNFSLTTGTFMHNTHLSLKIWYYIITNNDDNLSVRKLAKKYKLNKNTAYLIKLKINKAKNNRDKYYLRLKGVNL